MIFGIHIYQACASMAAPPSCLFDRGKRVRSITLKPFDKMVA